MQINLPSDTQAEQAGLTDVTVSAQAPKGFVHPSQSAKVGLKKPLNEKFQVEKSKSIRNRNKDS